MKCVNCRETVCCGMRKERRLFSLTRIYTVYERQPMFALTPPPYLNERSRSMGVFMPGQSDMFLFIPYTTPLECKQISTMFKLWVQNDNCKSRVILNKLFSPIKKIWRFPFGSESVYQTCSTISFSQGLVFSGNFLWILLVIKVFSQYAVNGCMYGLL